MARHRTMVGAWVLIAEVNLWELLDNKLKSMSRVGLGGTRHEFEDVRGLRQQKLK